MTVRNQRSFLIFLAMEALLLADGLALLALHLGFLLVHRAFRDGDDREGLVVLGAGLYHLGHAVEIVGDLGQQNDIRAAAQTIEHRQSSGDSVLPSICPIQVRSKAAFHADFMMEESSRALLTSSGSSSPCAISTIFTSSSSKA